MRQLKSEISLIKVSLNSLIQVFTYSQQNNFPKMFAIAQKICLLAVLIVALVASPSTAFRTQNLTPRAGSNEGRSFLTCRGGARRSSKSSKGFALKRNIVSSRGGGIESTQDISTAAIDAQFERNVEEMRSAMSNFMGTDRVR
jgi:hypothetical protein